jgi:hypothetical protein
MIGINNIFTILWFLIMLGCGGALSYISISKQLFTGDLIFIAKFFVGLLILITIGVAGFFLIKFRLILISKQKLITLKPFVFGLKKIDLNSIKSYKWTSWELKATVFRTVEIKTKNGDKIKISDFEFENFENLINKFPGDICTKEKSEVDYKQAKANLSFMTFMILIDLGLIGLIAYMNMSGKAYHWIHLIFYSITLILIYASQKRRKRYKLIIKNGIQQCI